MRLPASRHLAPSNGATETRPDEEVKEEKEEGVAELVWFNQLVIFGNFFLTTLCYPGLITAIPCKQMKFLDTNQWFQTMLLTVPPGSETRSLLKKDEHFTCFHMFSRDFT